jgi:hypothetical protein
MRFTFPRDFYIPKGSVKVADKGSDAVAYVRSYMFVPSNKLRWQIVIFWGKQNKPIENATYRSEAEAQKRIAECFDSRRKTDEFKKSLREERKAFVNDYKVGDMLYTSWGYDQTNVEFFQVVRSDGKSVWLRAIGGESNEKGYMTGDCSPTKDSFLTRSCVNVDNSPFRRLAQRHGVKIDDTRTAWKHVAGTTHRWSSYA